MEGKVEHGRAQDRSVVYNTHLPLSSNPMGFLLPSSANIKIQSKASSSKCSLDKVLGAWAIRRKFQYPVDIDYSDYL